MEDKKAELVDFVILVRKYKTTLSKKFLNRKPYVAPNPKEIKSYIPGTIIKLKVKEGAKVKAGETILILEAMKMMNKVLMPFDGKVKRICVTEGEKVPKGQLMIELE